MRTNSKKNLVIQDSLLTKRVVKERDKSIKRAQIIDLASDLIDEFGYTNISVDQIVNRASLAKGTFYLYFKTKEELGLSVLANDFNGWFNSLTLFVSSQNELSPQELSKWILQSLKSRERFISLLVLAPAILESNVSDEAALKFKTMLHENLQTSSQAIQKKMNHLKEGQATDYLMQVHSVVVGAWSLGFPSAKVKKIINDNNLHFFQEDYFSFLKKLLDRISRTLE